MCELLLSFVPIIIDILIMSGICKMHWFVGVEIRENLIVPVSLAFDVVQCCGKFSLARNVGAYLLPSFSSSLIISSYSLV